MDYHLNYRVLFTFFAIITLSFCFYPNLASALTITPTRFEISGDPGATLNEEMLIINETDQTETYYSSFSNFEAQGESGNPAFVDPKEGLGMWMQTDGSITLAPRQQKTVPIKITIPKNAEPGGHFAVVFWGTTNPNSGSNLSVGAKTGILVLLSVNGEVKEEAGLLSFNTVDNQFFFNTLPVSLEYRFKNEGGDRIKPSGQVTIRNTIFLPAAYLDANKVEGNVLPRSTRKINVDWIKHERGEGYVAPTNFVSKFFSDAYFQWKNFAVGLYSANLNVAYGSQGTQVKKTAFFFVFPWQLLIILFVIFIIVFWGGKKLIKRYNKFIIEKATGNNRTGTGVPPKSFHA